jgi:hypothetical protein
MCAEDAHVGLVAHEEQHVLPHQLLNILHMLELGVVFFGRHCVTHNTIHHERALVSPIRALSLSV